MEVARIRVIDDKGNAKFVMPHIANNAKLMKQYGFKIENISKDEPKPEAEELPVVPEIILEPKPEAEELPVVPEEKQGKNKPNGKGK